MAKFCDIILKESVIDNKIHDINESSLEKLVKLLEYISNKDLFGETYRPWQWLEKEVVESIQHVDVAAS